MPGKDQSLLPTYYQPELVEQVYKVPYEERAAQARAWAQEHAITPAAQDGFKIGLILVDVQNTFCLPGFELYVGGRSGRGALDDNRRLVEFIYRNLHRLTQIAATLDTHRAMQIFHAVFLVDSEGRNPPPYTLVSLEDVRQGRWRFNPAIAKTLGITPEYGQKHLEHYVETLHERGKYDLTIWPYHAMLGGIGHALVSAVEEAVFFHTIARDSQVKLEIKGNNALTESYSVVGPEVLTGPRGEPVASRSNHFIELVMAMDAIFVAGQAKSHCVAWTISDILEEIRQVDEKLAQRIYLLEDCSSPVVVPGAVDYTDQADEAYRRFADAGMHIVKSTDPIDLA